MLFALVPLTALPGYTDSTGGYFSGVPGEYFLCSSAVCTWRFAVLFGSCASFVLSCRFVLMLSHLEIHGHCGEHSEHEHHQSDCLLCPPPTHFPLPSADGAVSVTDSYYHYPTSGPMNGFTLDTRYGGGAGTTGFSGGATPLTDSGYSGMPIQLVNIN
jgi:hypothetical protein